MLSEQTSFHRRPTSSDLSSFFKMYLSSSFSSDSIRIKIIQGSWCVNLTPKMEFQLLGVPVVSVVGKFSQVSCSKASLLKKGTFQFYSKRLEMVPHFSAGKLAQSSFLFVVFLLFLDIFDRLWVLCFCNTDCEIISKCCSTHLSAIKSTKKRMKAGLFCFWLEEVGKELVPWRHKRTLLTKAVVKPKPWTLWKLANGLLSKVKATQPKRFWLFLLSDVRKHIRWARFLTGKFQEMLWSKGSNGIDALIIHKPRIVLIAWKGWEQN